MVNLHTLFMGIHVVGTLRLGSHSQWVAEPERKRRSPEWLSWGEKPGRCLNPFFELFLEPKVGHWIPLSASEWKQWLLSLLPFFNTTHLILPWVVTLPHSQLYAANPPPKAEVMATVICLVTVMWSTKVNESKFWDICWNYWKRDAFFPLGLRH